MARFTPLTDAQVTYTLTVEPECCAIVEGNLIDSGDAAQDAEDERETIARLERGDGLAWCCLRLSATHSTEAGKEYRAETTLGCCSFATNTRAKEIEDFAKSSGMHFDLLHEINEQLRQAWEVKIFRMCTTKFHGPTDRRGSRVSATHLTTKRRSIVPCDDALDMFENHAAAAERVLGRRPEFCTSVDGGGYIMGVDPRNEQ